MFACTRSSGEACDGRSQNIRARTPPPRRQLQRHLVPDPRLPQALGKMDGHEDRYQEERYLMVEGTDSQQEKVRKEPIREQAVQAGAEEKHNTEIIEIIVMQGGNQNDGQKELGDDGQLFSDEHPPISGSPRRPGEWQGAGTGESISGSPAREMPPGSRRPGAQKAPGGRRAVGKRNS